jgi:hypothetical protein
VDILCSRHGNQYDDCDVIDELVSYDISNHMQPSVLRMSWQNCQNAPDSLWLFCCKCGQNVISVKDMCMCPTHCNRFVCKDCWTAHVDTYLAANFGDYESSREWSFDNFVTCPCGSPQCGGLFSVDQTIHQCSSRTSDNIVDSCVR